MICKFDGCDRKLYSGNRTGFCRDHNHSDGCTCLQCGGEGFQREPEKTKVESSAVFVPNSTTNTSGRGHRISVAKAPWETDAD